LGRFPAGVPGLAAATRSRPKAPQNLLCDLGILGDLCVKSGRKTGTGGGSLTRIEQAVGIHRAYPRIFHARFLSANP
jgi:hypothetical protein